jgi:ABC-type dipeptide/oligopeptide/nickel transport system ATPase subunit
MKEERRILQKEVFPKLEAYCEENNAKFQAVDLRWGVTEESKLNQKTLDICLHEIKQCHMISPKLNFLILLGNRYGWQPIPACISEKEMKEILSVLTTEQNKLISTWYHLDTNAVPAEFVLQPRGKVYDAYKDWEKVETAIREALRDALCKLKFSPEQCVKYFTSATHQEIIEGALNPKYKTKEHVFAMVREINGLPLDPSVKDFVDLIEGQLDPYSVKQLMELKEQLKQKLGSHYISYQAKWKEDHTEINDPVAFENQVYDFLRGIIQEQVKEIISSDEIDHEINLHEEFKNRLTEHFCGRDDILKDIQSNLNNPFEKRILSLIGESGSGKSSVMAKVVELTMQNNEKALIVYRFIGVSSSSSNIISLLQSVSGQIAHAFNTTIEALADEGREKSLHDINSITEILKKSLALASEYKPVILFLDALDQLSDTDNAKALYWLPKELPDRVRIVISALPDLEASLSGTLIQKLPVLTEKDAKIILERWFESVSRKLETDQEKLVLTKFNKTKLPILLKLAFEQAKHWHSYDKNIQLNDDVQGIINDFINNLNQEHNEEFVEHVISYMLSGRYSGLAENEILEILVFDKEFWEEIFLKKMTHPDNKQGLIDLKKEMESSKAEPKRTMKIPIVLWSRLFLDLEPFLTERDADGVPIITFFHRQFNEVLRERYGLVEDEKGK